MRFQIKRERLKMSCYRGSAAFLAGIIVTFRLECFQHQTPRETFKELFPKIVSLPNEREKLLGIFATSINAQKQLEKTWGFPETVIPMMAEETLDKQSSSKVETAYPSSH